MSPPSPTTNGSSLMGSSSMDKLQKLESISTLTNVVGISLVNGIKLSGVYIGDTDMSVTLKYQPAENSLGNTSLPVTVIVTKLPVTNLTQLMSIVGSSKAIATTSGSTGSMESLLGQTDTNSIMGNNALGLLSIIRDIQIGAASIVTGNWSEPQTVSMGMLGSLRSPSTSLAPNEFITIIVVPFMGESSFPSVSLN